MATRTAVYVRVSTGDQVEGFSLDAQKRTCTEYAARHGMEIVGFYVEEGVSGRHDRRPAFQQLLAEIKTKRIKAVLIYDLDRFMRNLRLQLNLKAELDALGVSLVSLHDDIDTSTPEGVIQFQLKGMLAEWFSNQLSRKTKMGIAEKIAQGYWHGPVPTGYTMGEDRILVPSADQEAVRMAFRLYATALYSHATLADALNRHGDTVLNPQTGERTTYTKWNTREMLQNPVYIGKVRSGDAVYDGRHEPLIDQATWDTVQALHNHRKAKHGRAPTSPDAPRGGLLTGIVSCAACGAPAWHHSGKYYVCKRRYETPKCTTRGARCASVEAHLLETVAVLTLPEVWQGEVLARAKRLLTPAVPPVDTTLIERRLDRLKRLYLDGDLDHAEYQRERDALQAQLSTASAAARPTIDVAAVAGQFQTIGSVLEVANFTEQRALLTLLFAHVWVADHRVVALTPTQTYFPLVQAARERVSNNEPGGHPRLYLTQPLPSVWRHYRLAA